MKIKLHKCYYFKQTTFSIGAAKSENITGSEFKKCFL